VDRCNFKKYKEIPPIPRKKKDEIESEYDRITRLKIEKFHLPYGPTNNKEVNITGEYRDEIPNINELLKANIKKWPKLETMEEMVENCMRADRAEMNRL
jgi:hypothetical protein